jgi:outer membrane protein assembly factor BamB
MTFRKWAESGLANVADPGELAEVGYEDGDQLPAAEFNYALRQAFRQTRGLASVAEGIEQTEVGDAFLVAPAGVVPGELVKEREDDFGLICTDGLRLYCVGEGDNDTVYALDPRTLEVLWSAIQPHPCTALASAHGRLFVGFVSEGSEAKLRRLAPATGATLATYTSGVDDDAAPSRIVATDEAVYYVTSDDYIVRRLAADDLSGVTSFNHGAPIHDIAVGFWYLYLAGAAGVGGADAGKTVAKFNHNMTYINGATYDTLGARLLVNDEHLWLINEDPKASRKLSLDLDNLPWASPAMSLGGAVAQDDERIYTNVVSSGRLVAYSKETGAAVWYARSAGTALNGCSGMASDGMSVFAIGTAAGTYLSRFAVHRRARWLVHTDDTMLARLA